VAKTLERETWLGYEIVGFVEDNAPLGQEIYEGHLVIGRPSELRELIDAHSAGLVLVAASAFDDAARLNRLIWGLQGVDVDLQITSGTLDLMASRMVVQSVAGVPLLYIRRTGMDRVQQTIKRTLDVTVAALGLLLLSPVRTVDQKGLCGPGDISPGEGRARRQAVRLPQVPHHGSGC
jgi:hypothetical protein